MKHCYLAVADERLPDWQTAFPEGVAGQRGLALEEGACLYWVRLLAGESPAAALPAVPPGSVLVAMADDPDDALVMAAIEAGASGCCNSRAAAEVLLNVAAVVSHGGLWVGQDILRRLVGGTSRALAAQARSEAPDWAAPLSEREREVARAVAGGASNKEVADQLRITERTVKAHLTAIFEKLGLRDRLQLTLKINGL